MGVTFLPMSGDLARISPASYLGSGRFWREHVDFATVLAGGAGVLALLIAFCCVQGESEDQWVSWLLNI
ncbi:MAG TPA: hypothetical protein VF179_33410, partial [Thermoanaerobaculia bacterium]|nr:hypothetical protein [Thermoanaerobaculia bacterium]